MAYQNFAWCWNVVGIQGSEYVLLIYLTEQANPNGVTIPITVQRIMESTNISRPGVFRYLKRLETKGLVRRKNSHSLNGSQEPNVFVLDMKRFFPKDEFDDSGIKLWREILAVMDEYVDRRITADDLRVLRLIREVLVQRNTKTLWVLSTEEYIYEIFFRKIPDQGIDNLRLIKESAASLKLPIRRFEFFIKPNKPGRRG